MKPVQALTHMPHTDLRLGGRQSSRHLFFRLGQSEEFLQSSFCFPLCCTCLHLATMSTKKKAKTERKSAAPKVRSQISLRFFAAFPASRRPAWWTLLQAGAGAAGAGAEAKQEGYLLSKKEMDQKIASYKQFAERLQGDLKSALDSRDAINTQIAN